jgi:hypothetical protein
MKNISVSTSIFFILVSKNMQLHGTCSVQVEKHQKMRVEAREDTPGSDLPFFTHHSGF